MTIDNSESGTLLNLHAFLPVSYVNGPGARAVVWTQGCSLRCPGCGNPSTHSHQPRVQIEPDQLADYILTVAGLEGVTISGGEPFEQPEAVYHLCHALRKAGLSVMLFTGWNYHDIYRCSDAAARSLLKAIDILIDGPFIQELADSSLLWRGSSNQQVRFLTDRYSPDVLQNNHTQVEVVLKQDTTDMTITGFPDDIDIGTLSARLEAEADIVLETIETERNVHTIFGDKNYDRSGYSSKCKVPPRKCKKTRTLTISTKVVKEI